jgi:ATP-dependent DNA helicase RecG
MYDTPEQLLEKIRLGEDSFLELKTVAFAGDKVKGPKRADLADELAAFANAGGGVVTLGVDDETRDVLGIPEDRLDQVERLVADVVRDAIKPPLYPIVERMLLPSSEGALQAVIRVDVPRSLFVHQSPGGYLYRVGSSKRVMEPEYLARLFQQRSQARIIRFDEQVIPGATISDLDEGLVGRFRGPSGRDETPVLLQKLGMAREDGQGAVRPTVAGVLLGAADPERHLPHAMIQAVAYRGSEVAEQMDDSAYQLDAKDIGGPIDRQVAEACRFVVRNQKVSASKGVGRSDLPQYDLTAVFEALVNAVAHRDYSMPGTRVRLRLFANRLELFSPGALPNTMTVDSLPYRQANRNEAVTSLLARCSVPTDISGLESRRTAMMDRRGEGVSIILDRSEALSGRRPRYLMHDACELQLTIYAARPEADDEG